MSYQRVPDYSIYALIISICMIVSAGVQVYALIRVEVAIADTRKAMDEASKSFADGMKKYAEDMEKQFGKSP